MCELGRHYGAVVIVRHFHFFGYPECRVAHLNTVALFWRIRGRDLVHSVTFTRERERERHLFFINRRCLVGLYPAD